MDALETLWPLFGVRLRTERLTLALVHDHELPELVDAAAAGIYEQGESPFQSPWNQGHPMDVARSTLQWHWQNRATLRPERWTLLLGVKLNGALIGAQDLSAESFSLTRTVSSGSWLTKRAQGNGYGTEMRQAILGFAFDHLGATRAESAYFLDNYASAAVSRKAGYFPNGIARMVTEGAGRDEQRVLCTPETFVRPATALDVTGLTNDVRGQLGAEPVEAS